MQTLMPAVQPQQITAVSVCWARLLTPFALAMKAMVLLLPSSSCPAGACGAQPGFAAVQELLLAQWPSQEKLLLTEHSQKKHKNTTITGKD